MINLFRAWFAFSIAPLYFGGGGGTTSTASSSTTNTSTTNSDNRQVVSDSGMGFSNVSGGSSINITQSDGGAMAAARGMYDTSATMFKMSNDANVKNYDKLLNTSSDSLMGMLEFATGTLKEGFDSVKGAQENARAMMEVGQSKGTLDNKTIAMLGMAALAAVGLIAFRR